jgi:hypothetical protein
MNVEPYSASFIDILIKKIDRFPFRAWLFYVIAYLLLILLIHLAAWVSGIAPHGSIDFFALQLPIWLVLPLAFIDYLDRVARQALKKFRPALEIDDAEFGLLSYQLSTMPTKPIWILAGVGSLLAVGILVNSPEILHPFSSTIFGVVILLAIGLPAGWFGSSFMYHTARQLRLVNMLYERIEAINLFDLAPIHAFSILTARSGILLIAWIGLATVLNTVLERGGGPSDFILAVFATLISALAIATFAIPLWGIHERLVSEKERIEADNNRRVVAALFELHRRMDESDFEDMGSFRKGISGLLSFRAELGAVSTWPWQPATLRGLLSIVFLPIFIWTIQQILSQIMGL